MKNFVSFISGFLVVFALLSTVLKPEGVTAINHFDSIKVSPAQIDSIQSAIPIDLKIDLGESEVTPTSIVKYILSILGGLLTSIILFFLNKWFPNVFPSRRVKDYVPKK